MIRKFEMNTKLNSYKIPGFIVRFISVLHPDFNICECMVFYCCYCTCQNWQNKDVQPISNHIISSRRDCEKHTRQLFFDDNKYIYGDTSTVNFHHMNTSHLYIDVVFFFRVFSISNLLKFGYPTWLHGKWVCHLTLTFPVYCTLETLSPHPVVFITLLWTTRWLASITTRW